MKAPRKKFEDIDGYIASFPKDTREKLSQMRRIIKESAPGADEAIVWDMPTYKLNGNLVHFAAFRNHISLFPGSSGVSAFEKELSEYRTSKGTIQFPLDRKIPAGLIRRIVKYRVRENLGTP